MAISFVAIPILGAIFGGRRRRTHVSRRRRQEGRIEEKDTSSRRKAARRGKGDGAAPFPGFSGARTLQRRRIFVSEDGMEGEVGEGWWERRGKRVFSVALARGKEDPVLDTLKLAAAQFDWDQTPLPSGAQHVYDTVSALAEASQREEVPIEEIETAPKRKRRGRRGKGAKELADEEKEAAKEAARQKRNARARERRAEKRRAKEEEEAQQQQPESSAEAAEAPVETAGPSEGQEEPQAASEGTGSPQEPDSGAPSA